MEPISNPAYYNGRQSIVLSVFLLSGVDAVEFGKRLKQEIQKIEQSLPLGYVLDFATYQPELIKKSVSGMVINVIESMGIVLFVVMLLLGFRTGFIVGSFIPLVLGSVMIILLMASWFLSMFSSTSMCYWFLKPSPAGGGDPQQKSDPYQGRFYRIYRGILKVSLQHRILVLAFTAGVFAVALYAATYIPQAFFPNGDRNQYLIYLDLPAGTRIEETDRTVRNLSAWLQDKKENPEITDAIAYVGNGGPRFFLSLAPLDPDPFVAFLIVNTTDSEVVPELVQRTGVYLMENFPNVRGRVKSMWLGASETGLMEIRLSGPDTGVLMDQAQALMTALREIPGTTDIKQDWNNLVFTLKADVDQTRARSAGVTSEMVANSLDFFIDGTTTTYYHQGDVQIPIVGRGVEAERQSPDSLRTPAIYSSSGDPVPLTQVADVYATGELNRIVRYNQERTITVSAKNQALKTSELFAALTPALERMEFPENHHWEVGGELEDSAKAQKNLVKWMLPCFGGIVFLLVWQFNSIRRAAIIILTMPLVIVGAVGWWHVFDDPVLNRLIEKAYHQNLSLQVAGIRIYEARA